MLLCAVVNACFRAQRVLPGLVYVVCNLLGATSVVLEIGHKQSLLSPHP